MTINDAPRTSQAYGDILSPSTMDRLRYPREYTYFLIAAIVGGLIWFLLFLSSFGLILFYVAMIGGLLALASLFFRAQVLGNSVMVTDQQFPTIDALVKEGAYSLGIEAPRTFVVPGNGVLNAFAIRFISSRYVVLHSNVVDFALQRNQIEELRFIILHELTHHAAGHTGLWKNLLIAPASFIPFLGSAYSRACEYTCDSVAAYLIKDRTVSCRALLMLAHGSMALADEVDLERFTSQERLIPPFVGFLNEIISSHPRLTRRVLEIKNNQY